MKHEHKHAQLQPDLIQRDDQHAILRLHRYLRIAFDPLNQFGIYGADGRAQPEGWYAGKAEKDLCVSNRLLGAEAAHRENVCEEEERNVDEGGPKKSKA